MSIASSRSFTDQFQNDAAHNSADVSDRDTPDGAANTKTSKVSSMVNASDATKKGTAHEAAHEAAREMAQETALSFSGVSKVFPDGTHALDNVSLNVKKDEFVSLVGPSGCGKSTLLRLASGLDSPTAGKVDMKAKQLGYIFQDATLMPWRTVQGNVELLCELEKIPKEERRQMVQEAINLVGLQKFSKHYPDALSGGMKMRVSIARTLTLKPDVFLFDEPFGALDQITRERLNEETIRLFMNQRFSGLFVTHSVYEAIYLSTRVVVMSSRPGKIVEEVDIPFDFPRREDLRLSPEFFEIATRISHALQDSLVDEE